MFPSNSNAHTTFNVLVERCVHVHIIIYGIFHIFSILQMPQSERTDGKVLVKGDGSFAISFGDSLTFYCGTSTDRCYSHFLSKVSSLVPFIKSADIHLHV